MRISLGTILASFVLAVLGAAAAFAAPDDFVPTRGPGIGNNSYTTKIVTVEGVPDVDDYVAALFKGESVSVTLTSVKKSTLLPRLELIDPDGKTVNVAVRSAKVGRSLSIRS